MIPNSNIFSGSLNIKKQPETVKFFQAAAYLNLEI